jgi:hypothetical protein
MLLFNEKTRRFNRAAPTLSISGWSAYINHIGSTNPVKAFFTPILDQKSTTAVKSA